MTAWDVVFFPDARIDVVYDTALILEQQIVLIRLNDFCSIILKGIDISAVIMYAS